MTSTDLTSFCDSYNDSNKFLTAPNDLKTFVYGLIRAGC